MTGKVTREDRKQAWNELQRAAKERKTRPFYRAANKHGLMYAGKKCSSNFYSMLECHFLGFVAYFTLLCGNLFNRPLDLSLWFCPYQMLHP